MPTEHRKPLAPDLVIMGQRLFDMENGIAARLEVLGRDARVFWEHVRAALPPAALRGEARIAWDTHEIVWYE